MITQNTLFNRQESVNLDKLTNETVMKSISYDQIEIIKWILRLYCPSGIDVDVTYSKGNFYKTITEPKYKFDLNPQTSDTVKADFCHLPLKDNSVNSIMFDPPFTGGVPVTHKIGSNIVSNRFSSYWDMKELFKSYYNAMSEFYRVLSDNGVLIFKCQDTILSGKQYFVHVNIINKAYELGFYPKDLFVLLAKNVVLGHAGGYTKQYHARKFHSYFLVFLKQKSPVNY